MIVFPHVSRRVRAIAPSATKEMGVLASRVEGAVSLGQGIPVFPTSKAVVEAVVDFIQNDPASGRYSLQPGLPRLREAVAHTFLLEKGVEVDPQEEVLVTVGAMEGLLATFMTLVDPGDEIIVPCPAYASHVEQIQLAEGRPVFVPLRPSDWGLDRAAIEAALTDQTRAILLCNPSNPTGAVLSDDEVKWLAALAEESGLMLLADETYDALVYDRHPPLSPMSLPGMKDHVVSVSSFSKKYAATGWRVGWVVASAPLVEQISKVHDATAICAPTPSQHAAWAALTGPQDDVAALKAALSRRRELCLKRLSALAPAFDFVPPKGAFYVMARYRFSDAPSSEIARRLLFEGRVITVPGESYGPGGQGHLRLSFGGTEEEINLAFDRIEDWLKTYFGV